MSKEEFQSMLTTLRKYMKHILWIVAIAFIVMLVFSWGMGGFRTSRSIAEKGIIGEINGHKIQYQQFAMAIEQEVQAFRERSPNEELSEYRRNTMRNQVWERLVQDILFSQEIQRWNIQASPQEIVFQLRNNPPDFIRSNEQFMTEGEFDITKYRQALNDPQNYDAWIPVENYLRGTIPYLKLQQYILATIRITESEMREAYRIENERVNVEYLFFDPNQVSLENIEVPESEIAAYYKEHRENYSEPEKRILEYVLLEGEPSKEDSMQTYDDAQDVLEQLQSGADFAELAKDSDDPGSASKGGDLGFFGRGVMVKSFEDAAFAAKEGEIVGPVESQHGLHIIQVLDSRYEQGEKKIQARHILFKFTTSAETYDALYERAQYFYDELQRAGESKFKLFAEQEGLIVQETTPFPEGGFIPGIGMAARMSNAAFSEKRGWVSEPMGTGEDIVVFRIADIQKSHIRPLDEVRSSIENVLQREKQKSNAGEACRRFWAKTGHGADVRKAAIEDSLEVKETGLFSLQSYISGIGRDPVFSGTAFHLEKDTWSEPLETERGYYLIRKIEHVEIDEEIFQAQKENQKARLLQRKQQEIFMAWYNDLKENAEIKDYRNFFY